MVKNGSGDSGRQDLVIAESGPGDVHRINQKDVDKYGEGRGQGVPSVSLVGNLCRSLVW